MNESSPDANCGGTESVSSGTGEGTSVENSGKSRPNSLYQSSSDVVASDPLSLLELSEDYIPSDDGLTVTDPPTVCLEPLRVDFADGTDLTPSSETLSRAGDTASKESATYSPEPHDGSQPRGWVRSVTGALSESNLKGDS